MATNTASTVSHVWERQDDSLAVRATAQLETGSSPIISWRRITKWFGVLSTALLSAAALAPHTFRIPTALHPWVFVVAILWFLAFCAGMFDL